MRGPPFLCRAWAVAVIEVLQLVRDRGSLSLIALVPAAQILLFGFAINLEPDHTPVVLAGPGAEAGGAAWREISRGEAFSVVAAGLAPGEAEARVRAGAAVVGVEFPPAPPPGPFSVPAPVRVVVDGADPAGSAAALAALQARARAPQGGPTPVVVESLFNPAHKSSWTLAPGLIGIIVMITALMLGAQTLVREREAGTWEKLLTTPVTALEALVGKLSPYLAVAVLQALIALGLARLAFGLPARGAWPALIAATPLFAAAYLTLGFAISALARTRLQAIQAAVFVYLPSILLSGFMFPFRGMPAWARWVGEALPLTHFVRAARGALLRGADAAFVWRETAPVAVFAAFATLLSLIAYRRRLG